MTKSLDIIIHPINSCLVHSIRAGPIFYDNIYLLFQISVQQNSTRQLNNISTSQLGSDLNILPTHGQLNIHNALLFTLDIHYPVINKTTMLCPNASLYIIYIYHQNRSLRILESKWKKDKVVITNYITTFKINIA